MQPICEYIPARYTEQSYVNVQSLNWYIPCFGHNHRAWLTVWLVLTWYCFYVFNKQNYVLKSLLRNILFIEMCIILYFFWLVFLTIFLWDFFISVVLGTRYIFNNCYLILSCKHFFLFHRFFFLKYFKNVSKNTYIFIQEQSKDLKSHFGLYKLIKHFGPAPCFIQIYRKKI